MALVYLCLKRDLENEKYRIIRFNEHEFVATTKDGKTLVAHNQCSHRGFPVCQKLEGPLPISCPYHGKQFNFEKRIDTFELGEMIFLKDPNDNNFLNSEGISNIANELGKEFGRHKSILSSDPELWIQNTMDPNHLPHVHKEFSGLFHGTEPYEVECEENFSSYRMRVKEEVKNKYKQFGHCDSDFFHATIFPYLSITNFLDIFLSVETVTRINATTCEIDTRFFSSKLADIPNALCEQALEANIKVLKEDVETVNWWSYGNRKLKDELPIYMSGEKRIMHYVSRSEKWQRKDDTNELAFLSRPQG